LVAEGPLGGFDKLAAEAKAERVFLELLALLTRQERDVSPYPSKTYAPIIFESHPKAEAVRKKEFERAMERLLYPERIRVEPFGPPSRRRSRLVIAPSKEHDQ
jgi:hypothetical protein